jgi:triacylglycerol lipase
LIPGFMTGDWSMTPIAHALRSWDFKPARSGILLNVDCTNAVLDRLEARLETLAGRYQRTIPIVGWSRGGVLGKLLALRRPDLVGGLITIASPLAKPLAISSRVVRHIEILMRLSSQGVGGVMTSECIYGACGSEMLESLKMPVPPHIPYISIYSRTDGVIDWTSCLDPSARHIEIHSTHLGIGNSPRVWRLVANELLAMPAPLEQVQVQAKVS